MYERVGHDDTVTTYRQSLPNCRPRSPLDVTEKVYRIKIAEKRRTSGDSDPVYMSN